MPTPARQPAIVSRTRLALIFGGVASLLLVVNFMWIIDDWSRDLTTNFAATSEDAKRPALRPIHSPRSPAQLAEIVVAAARQIPRWELVEQQESDDGVQLHFVRTTPLLRFKDDIRITIARRDGESLLTAQSQSRIGKGDLGQNPRNLIELLAPVRKALE